LPDGTSPLHWKGEPTTDTTDLTNQEEVVKMSFVFSGLFWGAIVVLIGLTIILNGVLGVRIPIIRIVFGLLLIYWGISLLLGLSFRRASGATVFSETELKSSEASGKQDVVFGKTTIDLTGIQLKPGVNRYEVNTFFGASIIRLNPATPAKVVVSSAFGGVRMPDGSNVAFGENMWRSPTLKEDSAYLYIKVAVVFGGTEIQVR
jgi:hypothetical protein